MGCSSPSNDFFFTVFEYIFFTLKGTVQPSFKQLTEALATRHPLVALNPASLVREAVEASQNEETVVHTLTEQETTGSFEIVDSSQLATPSNTSRLSSNTCVNDCMKL